MLEWGVAADALAGERTSGDRHLVQRTPAGWLLAVIDGLGHGEHAARAAELASVAIERHAGDPLSAVVRHCHEALRRSRGVALTLAKIDTPQDALTWLGVGNVEAVLVRTDANGKPARQYLPLQGGVVGYQLPPLRESTLTLEPDDLLLLATDGIRAGFAETVRVHEPVQVLAEHILVQHRRPADDALVLVARCRREPVA